VADPRGRSGGFDWAGVQARLQDTCRALSAPGRSPDTVRLILEERAKRFASPPGEAVVAPLLELLAFPLGQERYAVELVRAEEVLHRASVTRVPCAPPSVMGVINHRGRIVTVVDLRGFLELPRSEVAEAPYVVVVAAGPMTFGIAAAGAPEVLRVRPGDLASPPAARTPRVRPFVQGVTPAAVLLIDVEGLARYPGFVVDEEVG
jgi:purine-binding chemotaxis protein CheW